jgi:hypothetical protein
MQCRNNMLHLLDGVADGDMVALLFCGWCEDEHVEVK